MWTRLLSVVSLPRSSTTRSASGHPYNYAAIFKSPILSSSSSRLIPVASTPHKLVLLPSLVSTPARSEPSALFSAPPHSSSEGKLALPDTEQFAPRRELNPRELFPSESLLSELSLSLSSLPSSEKVNLLRALERYSEISARLTELTAQLQSLWELQAQMQRAIEEREEYLSRLRAYCRQLREHILSKRERSILSTRSTSWYTWLLWGQILCAFLLFVDFFVIS